MVAVIEDAIAALRSKVADREVALAVATAETNGHEGRLRAEIADLKGQIAALDTVANPPAPALLLCDHCRREFAELNEQGLCDECAALPPAFEEPKPKKAKAS